MTVADIMEQAKALSLAERKELAKLLIDTLDAPIATSNAEEKHSILELEGIAAHLADEEDPQAYVNRIRNEWDDRP